MQETIYACSCGYARVCAFISGHKHLCACYCMQNYSSSVVWYVYPGVYVRIHMHVCVDSRFSPYCIRLSGISTLKFTANHLAG
ncbi:rCG57220 [Rattus norvegicus]|uniref:RCG57220 n=1 Tax=Rattus norvegicus TaxID=10116 RepID=A6KPG2_RAT|nr:rCG57220 [Rattus norvegicus]